MKKSHGGIVKRSRSVRSLGRLSAAARLRSYAVGTRVRIRVNPSVRKGKPNTLRFNNRSGVIAAKRGSCFEVRFNDGRKAKMLVVGNAHLTPA
jgi:ribosomal protein L21E